ncbi:hypothetical protein NND66_10265, partial [Enterococcus faecium]|nr:hypothetical protein [Enterococcus faecium]MDV4499998.1 hypothetical protein [Enterococcus faecium]MDV4678055.1 hypothetical protein [Enterococcus faecium]MDV4776096.1 hypothetical protein [Enterococcus faecium]
ITAIDSLFVFLFICFYLQLLTLKFLNYENLSIGGILINGISLSTRSLPFSKYLKKGEWL